MKISVMSDLHLEHSELSGLPGGDVLVLAGDTFNCRSIIEWYRLNGQDEMFKRYVRFCQEELAKYKQVVLVLGNHEFYGCEFGETARILRVFMRAFAPMAEVLDMDVVQIGGISFLGTTLWSDCSGHEAIVGNLMNDYVTIKVRDGEEVRRLRPVDTIKAHRESVIWLDQTIPLFENVVVVTHHAPSFQSNPSFGRDRLSSAYCTNLEWMINRRSNVLAWVHGHTHHSVAYEVDGCRVASYQRGYPHEKLYSWFQEGGAQLSFDEGRALVEVPA